MGNINMPPSPKDIHKITMIVKLCLIILLVSIMVVANAIQKSSNISSPPNKFEKPINIQNQVCPVNGTEC